ncbi:AAA family ATPase [Paenibacillus sp. Marseille-Q4541]|uniref:AAA family ATPase n=1 Tax=Paenibacillus sp. Marseille-Q4541 TaxID=2831522 RepID=UPI001BA879BF
MKFVIIFGPQAVGKMTVGQEIARKTGMKLFHNHMTIDLVSSFFSYGTPSGKRLVSLFRQEIFEEVAKSDLSGLIFTFVWAFDLPEDGQYVEKISEIFTSNGGTVYYVELEADTDERVRRNRTPNRLEHKPTKRDIAFSEQDLLETMKRYRLNSWEGEITKENYVRINNTDVDAEETADLIIEHFGWLEWKDREW